MYEVAQSVIDETKKCDRNFECLSKEGKPSCKIESCISGKVYFVEKLERICMYHQDFGYSHLCTCPIRNAIHKKYDE